MGELLLEIGTEEIPSDYLNGGLRELKSLAQDYLEANHIKIEQDLYTCGTPRRLVLIGKAVAGMQEDVVQEITGPPGKVAYDGEGNPTKAAFGFAEKQGVSVDDLTLIETPKGEYLHVKRKIPGRSTKEVLVEILPRLIADIPWPKSMRWGSGSATFVRPVHWILALFEGDIIPFEAVGMISGNTSRGHRFMNPESVTIDNLQDYLKKMEDNAVIIDLEQRMGMVEKAVMDASRISGGTPASDPELLSTVTNMVEYPSAVCGEFDRAFLDIPDPVLITAMKKHQRYFAVRDRQGLLLPHFVAVNNTVARDEKVVKIGHERVLRARLADADFFFKEDRKKRLEDRLADLKNVIYQAKLGTSFAKVERFSRLADYLADRIVPEKREEVALVARLCKCDLVTEMVMEFPTLQGIMGTEYARLDGHPEDVCLGVREHYLPARAGDELPQSVSGAIVGIADRMDTIAGCFAVQLEPTGAADPFALRRHALAIIRILEGMSWDLSLREFINESLSIVNEDIEFDRDRVFGKVSGFFRERYRNMMARSGYESDLIEAVISVEFDRIDQLHQRIDHLKRFVTESAEFESLVLTFKRVNNIIKKQPESLNVDHGLFEEPCEFRLWEAYRELEGDVYNALERGEYFEAINLMNRLRKPVDDLFDTVEIMIKDHPELRDNRVGMLQSIARLFLSLADFSKFSI